MNKSKSFAIGAFISGALLLIFVALFFFSGGQFFSEKERVVMYFNDSVQGLQIGAPIKLKGVVLGEIVEINLNFQYDEKNWQGNEKNLVTAVSADLALKRINQKGTYVDRQFFADAIQKGLRAQLNYQSILTGLLYVELDFFPERPAQIYGFQKNVLEIPTVNTEFGEISKNFQDMNLKGLIENLDGLVFQINQVIKTGAIQETLSSFKHAADSIEKTSTTLNKEIATLSLNYNETSVQLNQLLKTINHQAPALTNNLNTSLLALEKSLQSINKTSDVLQQEFSADSPLMIELTDTIKEMGRAAQALRSLSETLEQQPESVFRGKVIYDEKK
jgi:paraquat-inducible protein B